MSRLVFHRPVRALPPPVSEERFTLPAVPRQSQNPNATSSWMTLLLPVMSSVTMAAYMISYGRPLLVTLGIVFVIGSVGVAYAMRMQMRNAARRSTVKQRDKYLAHLSDVRAAARRVAAQQRFAAAWIHPSPARLPALARRRRRVWERRADDADFLLIRAGLGTASLHSPIQIDARNDPLADYDEATMAAANRVVRALGTVGRQPALVDLARAGVVTLLGPRTRVRAMARSMVSQLAVLHAPDDLLLAVYTDGDPDWDAAKWLPHTAQQGIAYGETPPPLVSADMSTLSSVLTAELDRIREQRADRRARAELPGEAKGRGRRLVLVLDGYDPAAAWTRDPAVSALLEAAGPEYGITVLCLVAAEQEEPGRARVRLRVGADGALSVEGPDSRLYRAVEHGLADRMDGAAFEETARALAPLLLAEEPDRLLTRTVSMSDLLGVPDLAAFDPTSAWLKAVDERVLRLAIGIDGQGAPVDLDLKESAQGGMGPHGLIVGATGSGKSELLRTLVTGLTMTHSPELLSLVLVDFKGGATFAGVTELPHVAGLITNLADDLSLVERVRAALHGEQQRRQRILRDAGNVDSLREYQLRQAAGESDVHGKPLEPLPYLLIVVDEFGELLSQRSDFIDLFVQIGRVGRSLGMHLLLATQRLEEGRLRGLESHLSYRICLRTFSAAESRAVIGTADAYNLPPIPGSAYLKVDESQYRRFRVAHISEPYQSPDEAGAEPAAYAGPTPFEARTAANLAAFEARIAEQEGQDPDRPRARPARMGPSAMKVAVENLCRYGRPVHQVWLPPLPAAVSLDALLGPLSLQPGRGWQAAHWPGRGRLAFPLGLIDLPFQQRQEPLILDFARKHGNLAVAGAPRSGKSTLLRTLMLSAILTHTPDEIRFSCVDYGGGTLASFARAPHVGTIAGRRDPERALRVFEETLRVVAAREQAFADHGIESPTALRDLARTGQTPAGMDAADVFVLIDNWGAVRAEVEGADALLSELAFRGLGVGVHVILTVNRWGDVRLNLRDAIGSRLELKLNDAAESEVSRPTQRMLPEATPGRGAAPPGLLFHTLIPRMDGMDGTEELAEAQEEVLAKVAGSWSGAVAQAVRMLPERVTAAQLSAAVGVQASDASGRAQAGVPIGLGDPDLAAVHLDLGAGDPHLLVLGDAGSGKSVFLRTLMRGLTAAAPAEAVRFFVVDVRRSLIDVAPEPYLGAYAGDQAAAREYTEQLREVLDARMPPPSLSAAELRRRAWWSGPELYVVIDDYDLLGSARPGPLAALADYLPQARDIGLHVVLARRVAGSSRAFASDQLLSRVRELGSPGLVLDGDPKEGVLIGGERAQSRLPGRGVLVGRRGPARTVQVAHTDEAYE